MLVQVRSAVHYTSGGRDSLGSAAAIPALLSLTGRPGESRELRSPMPTMELEGRETEFIIQHLTTFLLTLGNKKQAPFLVLQIRLLLHRAELIWNHGASLLAQW